MIVYDLLCACGCQFEGWFAGREEYERQEREGLLLCPACGGRVIRRVLSPVAGRRSGGGQAASPRQAEMKAAIEALHTLQDFVRKNFENVGARFVETSLRMHYGLEERRNIRGVATGEEERRLERAGVQIVKIPLPPEEETN